MTLNIPSNILAQLPAPDPVFLTAAFSLEPGQREGIIREIQDRLAQGTWNPLYLANRLAQLGALGVTTPGTETRLDPVESLLVAQQEVRANVTAAPPATFPTTTSSPKSTAGVALGLAALALAFGRRGR